MRSEMARIWLADSASSPVWPATSRMIARSLATKELKPWANAPISSLLALGSSRVRSPSPSAISVSAAAVWRIGRAMDRESQTASIRPQTIARANTPIEALRPRINAPAARALASSAIWRDNSASRSNRAWISSAFCLAWPRLRSMASVRPSRESALRPSTIWLDNPVHSASAASACATRSISSRLFA
ncbi:MAG: hypothetical protein BWZ10_01734 [candidate division BRC1 bacterium ADurb.BinA364]|nr:MAG: hypothetical protein BWZ10_01734 [candidate division BRC1 bacterium ADurb.BinA364]